MSALEQLLVIYAKTISGGHLQRFDGFVERA
jgi:hypothetical protein